MSEVDLAVVIIDITPSMHFVRLGEGIISNCLDSIMVFCCSHLASSPFKKLAIIGCHTQKCDFIYPPVSDEANLGMPYVSFQKLDSIIRSNIKSLILDESHQCINTETLLAGALSMALCYVNRSQKELEKKGLSQKNAKILIITSSGDSLSQYLSFMNSFFTAQKQSTKIDACVLEKDSGLLKQGCDITGGMYMKINNYAAFLQYTLWIFLNNEESRNALILPPSAHADFKTACFCHGNSIDIGYVCSVCLSVFCNFSPICSTCQVTFKFNAKLPALKMKKKKKSHL